MENSMEVPQKIKNRPIIRSSNPSPGIHPKEMKIGYWRGICTPIFIATLFTIAKIWKQSKCPSTDEWIKKMWDMYTYLYHIYNIYIMEYYLAMRKKNLAI